MFGRALGSVGLAIVVCCYAATSARAQNLEAGKSPPQIFNGACAVCHKSPRGLVKTVPPGSLPGFLRQHYTTSSDMAAMLSGYLLSNGAVDTRRREPSSSRRGREAKPVAAPEPAPAPAPAQRSWWPWHNEPAAQSAGANTPPVGPEREAGGRADRNPGAKHRAKKKSKSGTNDSKQEHSSQPPAGNENVKPEAPKSEMPKSEPGNHAPEKRADPVPAVTPAPGASESKAPESRAPESKAPASEASEPKAAEPKAAEPKTSEPKAAEPKVSEPKASEPGSSASEPKASEPKAD